MDLKRLHSTDATALKQHLQEVITRIEGVEHLAGYTDTLTNIIAGQDVTTRLMQTFAVDGIDFQHTNGGLNGSHKLVSLEQSNGIDIITADFTSAYPYIMLNSGILSAEGFKEVANLLELKQQGNKDAKSILVRLYGNSKHESKLEGITTPTNVIVALLGQILITELATAMLQQQEGSRLLKVETDGVYICRDLDGAVLPQWKDRTKILDSTYVPGEYPYSVERLHSLKLDVNGRKQYTIVDRAGERNQHQDGHFEATTTKDNYSNIIIPSDLPTAVILPSTAQKGKRLKYTKEITSVPIEQRGDIFYYGSGVNGKGEASINDRYTYTDIVASDNNDRSVKLLLKHSSIICIDIDPVATDKEGHYPVGHNAELVSIVTELQKVTDGFTTYSTKKSNSVHIYTTIDRINAKVKDLLNQLEELDVIKDIEILGHKLKSKMVVIKRRGGILLKSSDPEYLANLCSWIYLHQPEHCVFKGDTADAIAIKTKVPNEVVDYLYQIGIELQNRHTRATTYRFECLAKHNHNQNAGSIFYSADAQQWLLNCHACTPAEKTEHIHKHNSYIKRIQDAIKVESYEPNRTPFKQRSVVLDTRPTGQGKTYDMVQEIADTYDPTSDNHNRQVLIIVPTNNMVKVVRRELLKTKIVQTRDIVEFTKESNTVNKHYQYYINGQTEQQAELERLAKIKETDGTGEDKKKPVKSTVVDTKIIKPARIIIMLSTYLKVYTDADTSYLIKYTEGVGNTHPHCNAILIRSILEVTKTALIYIDEVDTVIADASIFMKGLRFHDIKHKRDISADAYYRLSDLKRSNILVLQKYAGLNNLLQEGEDAGEWTATRSVTTQGNQDARYYDVTVTENWQQDGSYNGLLFGKVFKLTRWNVNQADGAFVRNQKLSVTYVHLATPLIRLISEAQHIKLISATISLEYLNVFGVVPTKHIQDTEATTLDNIFEYYKDIIVVETDTLGDRDLRRYCKLHEHDGGTLVVKGSKLSVDSIKDSKAYEQGLSLLIEKSLSKHKETIGTELLHSNELPDIVTYILQPDMRGSSLYGDYTTLLLATNRYSPLEELYDFGYLSLFINNRVGFNGLLKNTLMQTIGRLTRHTSSKNKRLILLTPEVKHNTILQKTAQQELTQELQEHGRELMEYLTYYKKHTDYFKSLLPTEWNKMETLLQAINADNGYVWTTEQTEFVARWNRLDKKEGAKVLKQLRDYYKRTNQAELTIGKLHAKLFELIS